MNACRAIELALKDTLAKYGEVGGDVWLCCEQSQTKDFDFEERRKNARYFPQVLISATPEGADDNAWTFQQPVDLLVATMAADDPFAQTRADIYDAIRGVVDAMYYQGLARNGETDNELHFFSHAFNDYLQTGVNVGFITLPANSPPAISGDVQTMSIALVVHWTAAL